MSAAVDQIVLELNQLSASVEATKRRANRLWIDTLEAPERAKLTYAFARLKRAAR